MHVLSKVGTQSALLLLLLCKIIYYNFKNKILLTYFRRIVLCLVLINRVLVEGNYSAPQWNMRSQAMEGRHNLTGREPCVWGIYQQPPPPPPTRQRRVGGGGGKRHVEIGLTPYPVLCRPFRAWLRMLYDRAHALSYVMSPFQGYMSHVFNSKYSRVFDLNQ